MKLQPILNTALATFDRVGYRLDDFGITSNLNRHQTLAFLMSEQKRLEGEIDSFRARFDCRRSRAEHLLAQIEQSARSGVHLALTPVRFTLTSVRGLVG